MEEKSAKEEFTQQVEAEQQKQEEVEISVELPEEENNEINFDNLDENALARANEEILALKEDLLRVQADGENYKKRLEKDKINAVSYANESFSKDMLSVLDTLDMAIANIDENKCDEFSLKLKEGIELTIEKFLTTLKKNGVEEVINEGEFNPNFHNAIMKVDSEDHQSGEIVTVMQKGYSINDRVIRASMVSIAN